MGQIWISQLNRVRLLLFLLALPIYWELFSLIWDSYARLDENPLVFVVPALMLAPLVGLMRCLDYSEPDANEALGRADLATFALCPVVLMLARSLPEDSLVAYMEIAALGLGALVVLSSKVFFLALCWVIIFQETDKSSGIVDRFVGRVKAVTVSYPRDSLVLLLVSPLSPLLLVAVLSYVIMNLFAVRTS